MHDFKEMKQLLDWYRSKRLERAEYQANRERLLAL